MTTVDNTNLYLSSFIYSFTKPTFAAMLANSVDLVSLSKAGAEAKFMTLGALLATGRLDVFVELVNELDFSEISFDSRDQIAYQLFTLFSKSKHLLTGTPASTDLAAALMKLLVSTCPESLLAHELECDPLPSYPLIKLDYVKKINQSVSGVVFFREFTLGPGSRKHEFGYRIKLALASQGWNVSLLSLQEMSRYSCSNISDFALIDVAGLPDKPPYDDVCKIISPLKRYFRKIIVIDPDPWNGTHDEMLKMYSCYFDYIWGFTADWKMARDPLYSDRSILFPNVGGFDHLGRCRQFDLAWNKCTFNFTGSVQRNNLNRAYWILEMIRYNLSVSINITTPGVDDGLDHDKSLQLYAQLLASTHASLNFTTRRDGSQILTARSVEIISINRLLIQERCPAFHYYYVEGEHFLEFGDIKELCTIIEFLESHPQVAQRICSNGYQFYQERYSSQKLVEHIQTFL